MAGRGTARSTKGASGDRGKKTKWSPLPEESTERYEELIRRSDSYLVEELERCVQEEGNSAEAIRLRRHFVERLQAAGGQGAGEAGDPGSAASPASRKGALGWLEANVDGQG